MKSLFNHLPVFATDLEICQVIVGKARAAWWKRCILPIMARKAGFPPLDGLHGGRSVPQLLQFYVDYLRIPPKPVDFVSTLDLLPLFATDDEIALALVGKKHAAAWIEKSAPALQSILPGFPRVDPLHDGRPVPVLKVFYAKYFRLPGADFVIGQDAGEEDPTAWKKSRRHRKRSVWSGGKTD